MRPRRLLLRYVGGLTWAYLLTLAEVVAIVVSLGGRRTMNVEGLVILAVQVVVGSALVAVGAVLTVRPTLQWLGSGTPPTDAQVIGAVQRSLDEDALMEWAVEERFINATQAMLIDLEKCTRCDDCIRACSSTHGGDPRFIRHGKVLDHWMVANACMHCADPVCMIGCPTGAIRRTVDGEVVIEDATCIGCATCASNCPYDNNEFFRIISAAC